uniref:Secreted protein n=1 Tax=Anopheles darlingi TaxID=43151 RepID=A0A2M4DH66_ANODA
MPTAAAAATAGLLLTLLRIRVSGVWFSSARVSFFVIYLPPSTFMEWSAECEHGYLASPHDFRRCRILFEPKVPDNVDDLHVSVRFVFFYVFSAFLRPVGGFMTNTQTHTHMVYLYSSTVQVSLLEECLYGD